MTLENSYIVIANLRSNPEKSGNSNILMQLL